ncbi:hypothetical protein IG631_15596 [Alternaria alternata]|nr:hypothetical protein IG631_15596 [Alternaria alternata]
MQDLMLITAVYFATNASHCVLACRAKGMMHLSRRKKFDSSGATSSLENQDEDPTLNGACSLSKDQFSPRAAAILQRTLIEPTNFSYAADLVSDLSRALCGVQKRLPWIGCKFPSNPSAVSTYPHSRLSPEHDVRTDFSTSRMRSTKTSRI